jgi:hypothetical protein
LVQVLAGGDGDDAVVNGVPDLRLRRGDAAKDDIQGLGEPDVAQAGGHRGVATDAAGFQRLPIDEDVGAGDIAKEVDHVRERDGFKIDFRDFFLERRLEGIGVLTRRWGSPPPRDLVFQERPDAGRVVILRV